MGGPHRIVNQLLVSLLYTTAIPVKLKVEDDVYGTL